jgi:2-polyprenyl-6-methoxyphenol hydroxylase-like FAD-dependent oxidoreductase
VDVVIVGGGIAGLAAAAALSRQRPVAGVVEARELPSSLPTSRRGDSPVMALTAASAP